MKRFTIKKINKYVWGFGEFKHTEKVISYLITGEKTSLLFDTGMGIGNIYKEITNITKMPIIVINSHHHFDHIGGNWRFNNIYSNNHIFMKQAQKGINTKNIYKNFQDKCFYEKPKKFSKENFCIKPFTITKILKNDFYMPPFYFKILHTPGHSDDSICIYEKTQGWLFTGDILYDGKLYIQNKKKYIQSIEKIEKLSIKHIFPGHNSFSFDIKKIDTIKKIIKNE